MRADPAAAGVLSHPYARRVPGPVLAQDVDFAQKVFETRFRWTRAAPMELWRGDPPTPHSLVREAAPGEVVPCGPAPDAPVGVLRCPPAEVPLAPRYGEVYRLHLGP